MKRDIIIPAKDFRSSFLSCEKDCETILKRLFVTSQPFSDDLKRLLVINTKDCLDNHSSQVYNNIIKNTSLQSLCDDGYILLSPRLKHIDHENMKSYIIISFDNFSPTSNDEFRDCSIIFDILCHADAWDIGNFRQRPLKIVGYIDGILNRARLSGIGELQFLGCNELVLDEHYSGYTLMYRAVHQIDDGDDRIPGEE